MLLATTRDSFGCATIAAISSCDEAALDTQGDFEMRILKQMLVLASLMMATQANAIPVSSGQTNVLLDVELLASVGLTLSGVGGGTIVPGNLGPGSVAFSIIGTTTFQYTAGTFAPFSGTIEHAGTVSFNANTLTVGNFTIGFDAARVSATTSGFFVADNVKFPGVALFDIGNPSSLVATAIDLTIAADLLVSAELAGVLQNTALTGVDVGDALVEARSVAEPATVMLLLAGTALAGVARRRSKPGR
jgi:hypothetical protein